MPAPWLVTRPPTHRRTSVLAAVKTVNRCNPGLFVERVILQAARLEGASSQGADSHELANGREPKAEPRIKGKPLRTPDGRSGVAANQTREPSLPALSLAYGISTVKSCFTEPFTSMLCDNPGFAPCV